MSKTHSEKVDRKLVVELLNASGVQPSANGMLLGDALLETIDQLARLIEESNVFLEKSKLAAVVAGHLALKSHRKGHAVITISAGGVARLEISPVKKGPKPRRSKAPLMSELRAQAEKLGVDISTFGAKRRLIQEFLETRKQSLKESPVVSEEDSGPMSAGPDETRVSPAPSQIPPKRTGFLKTGMPVPASLLTSETTPKKSLRELVVAAKEVDIANLLGSEDS